MSASSDPDLVFYDGDCGLCHGIVRFLLARDADGSRFRFAPLHGATFVAMVPAGVPPSLPDSFVLRAADGGVFVRSAAAARALRRLPAPWALAGRVLAALPHPLADGLYDRIARARRKLAAAPGGRCPVVAPELRGRFLD